MKVLHVEGGRHYYGGGRQVVYLLEGLAKRGHRSTLVCPPGAEIIPHAAPFATVVPVRLGGDLDALQALRIARVIRGVRPDVVHVHSRRGVDLWGGLAAKWCGVPRVLSRRVDNTESALGAAKYGLYDRVITISQAIRTVLLRAGVPEGKVTCVRSALDPGPYLHIVDRDAFRREFQLPDGAVVAGVVAQLIQRKGHRHLLAALPNLVAEFPMLRVLVFGKGPLERALRASVQERRLTDVVRFAGFRDDLPKWLGGLDVLVHPAEIEGLGVSLLQAAAAGVPIVASNAGGMPEAVADGETGVLTPPGDVAALTAALGGLLRDGDLRRRLGEAGRRRIVAEFSIEAMVEGNAGEYARVVGGASTR